MGNLSHFFLPHKKNKYRAHLLKPIALQAVIFFLIALQFSFVYIKQANPAVLGVSYNITPQEIVNQTNDWRGKSGLNALRLNGPLSVAAQLKGQDMLEKGYWAHVSPDGKAPWYWINRAGYNYLRAGENLAKDFRDTTSTVNAWMNSPGHKANILNPNYKDIGIGVVSGPFNGYDTVIVVQMFGDPAGGLASLQNPQSAAAQRPVAIGKKIELKLDSEDTSSTISANINESSQFVKPGDAQTENLATPISSNPAIDPVQVFKTLVSVLGVLFIILLVADAYLVAKNRINRKNHGHSLFHAIFLGVILITILLINTGVIL
ncbi:MAG: CAP domain-containing protein [bacterium]|nr:CAP domain-containing protein [bacterium]